MSDDDRNMFGGKNPRGLYVPMSEDEQEVLERLVQSKDLVLDIKGWAVLENPKLIVGDLRVGIPFTLKFSGGMTRIQFLDLELKKANGMLIFKQRMPVHPPLDAMDGMEVGLQWDIAIDHMDPEFVKAIKPGAVGITSRRLDKETGERTATGNMILDATGRRILNQVDEDAKRTRQQDAAEVAAISRGGQNPDE